MLALGILLLLIGIPSMLFIFIYAIYAFVKFHIEQKRQETYFADCRLASKEATQDKYGKTVMPEWFREKYPKGILGVWGIE